MDRTRAGPPIFVECVSANHLVQSTAVIDSMVDYNNRIVVEDCLGYPHDRVNLTRGMLELINWLALHNVPTRSIAFSMRELVPMKKELKSTKPYSIRLEQHVEIIEEFIRRAIWEIFDISWRLIGNPAFFRARVLRRDRGRGEFRTILHEAMEHALLDDGKEICSNRPERHVTRHAGLEDDNFEADEKLLLWRSITGPFPRYSRSIPKNLRVSMFTRHKARQMQRLIEQQLGYTDGEFKKEEALMSQMSDKIDQGGTIDRELAGPRPFSEYIGGEEGSTTAQGQ